jgi:uncharacterized protein (TIGR02099 family)
VQALYAHAGPLESVHGQRPLIMPAQRTTPAPAVPRTVRLLRVAANTIVLCVALACVLLLLVRLVAFPRIEAHREAIAAALAARIGQPVAIGSIVTGWDGWNPRLSIRGFTVSDAATAQPVLELPQVDLVVSWTSLPLLDLRLRELVLEGARLAVRRDERGRFHVAGIEIDPQAAGDDTRLSDWLLRQRRIVVHDGLLTWTDERRHAPQLVLDHVELRVEQGFGEHRFGLTGVPPPELAAPLDLRGEFTGASLRDWQSGHARTYLRLDYADLAAWMEWLPPLPVRVDRGKGALRLWFEFAEGEARAMTADVELADVRARFGEALPEAELAHVAGRISARQQEGRRELVTRGLTLVAGDGRVLPATNLTLQLQAPRGSVPAHAELAFDQLALAPLSALAAQLPLPEAWRAELVALAPQGTLRDGRLAFDGPPDDPVRFAATARFAEVGFRARDARPGAAGLTGRFEASEAKGTITLEPHPLTLDLPHVFAAPLAFDTAQAQVQWTRGPDGLAVRIDDARFANADAAGTAAGTWHASAQGPGMIDLRGRLTRATVEPLARYLPLAIDAHVREWLGRALVRGTSNDVELVLQGDLDRFPFAQGQGGNFLVAIKGRGATLDYAGSWPQITDVDAEVRFENARMTIDAARGRVLGAAIGRTRVEIPDLRAHPALLRVEGTAQGATRTFLDFIGHSPVDRMIDGAIQGVQASGDGRLALRFELPLSLDRVTVAGEYEILGNDIRWPGAPPLAKVTGKVAFNNDEVQARDVSVETLGGPARVSITAADANVRLAASGNASVAAVRGEYDVPLLDRASGNADWRLELERTASGTAWTLDSSLEGMALDVPAPLGKAAAAGVPLRVASRPGRTAREDSLTVDYGSVARIVVHRVPGESPRVDRALVQVGNAIDRTADAERRGIWIRAALPAVNVDDWLAWQRATRAPQATGTAGGALALEGVDLDAGVVQAMGRRFEALKVTGRRNGEDWRLELAGRDIQGTATWQAATASQPNGRVVARLARLVPPAAGDLPTWAGAPEEPARPATAANPWPAIDLTAESFHRRGHDVGRLAIAAEPSGRDWQIRKLALVNDAGRIDAEGVWRGGRSPQTRLDVKVDVREAGRFLARFAMPDAIRGAPTTIEGQLSWAGAPSDFDYPSLSGNFRVQAGAGQFLKVDPGVGRLLGVLSLQALPRRISLDFRDVFSEGFAFDSASGTVRIQNGVMHTDALRLAGPAASVSIGGDVDLARETQKLQVRVQPALSTSVSAGAAALFLANPLLGAAVGAGTFLAQRMFNNPIEQLFSYEYAVTGSWDDPQVQRVRRVGLPETSTASSAPSPASPPVEGPPPPPANPPSEGKP